MSVSRWRHAWLPIAGLLALAFFVQARANGPFDPAGRLRYHSGPGDIQDRLGFVLAELGMLYAILRPWSYRRSWGRPLLALLLFVPWALLMAIASMHSGPVVQAHTMWLSLMCAGLFVTSLVSFLAGPPSAEPQVSAAGLENVERLHN